MEVWKDIAGFEGFYQVSNYGRVRSLTRTQPTPNRYGGITMRTVQGAILTPSDNGNGYKIISLSSVGRKRKNYYVHRLVAETFIPRIDGCDVVNHLDHDSSNNHVENLEWCTQQINMQYSAHLLKHEKSVCKPTNTGEKHIRFRNGSYCVGIDSLRIWKNFKTLEEAIRFRNEVMQGA